MLDLVKLCLPGKERNPFSKRCNKKCKKGKERILLNQTKTYRCYKTCEKPRERNSKTNRCRGRKTPSKHNFTKPYHNKSSKNKDFFNRSALWGDDSRSRSH